MLVSLALLSSIAALPGCVVWDINDGIIASNGNLGQIESGLNEIGDELGETNTNLQSVEARLTSMDEQLKALQTQLDSTNKHLESLRKTINNIDSTIPFLKLSGDDEEEQEALENGESPTPSEPVKE
jgi:septal ring factor EnvC (AmiA/AmiB activator)